MDRRQFAERSQDVNLKLGAMEEAADEHDAIAKELGLKSLIDDIQVIDTDPDSVDEATRTITSKTRHLLRHSGRIPSDTATWTPSDTTVGEHPYEQHEQRN